MKYIFTLSIEMFVHFLLLLAVNQMFHTQISRLRCLIVSILCTSYTCIWFLKGFRVLELAVFRIIYLLFIGGMAYGLRRQSILKIFLFALFNTLLETDPRNKTNNWTWLLLGATFILFRQFTNYKQQEKLYVTVKIFWKGDWIQTIALRDSGNFLCDPITGTSVMVVDAAIASRLIGLSAEQLKCPIGVIEKQPFFRLIPIQTISSQREFLLAKKFPDVQVGEWRGSLLIAFSSQIFSPNGNFQALVGGNGL